MNPTRSQRRVATLLAAAALKEEDTAARHVAQLREQIEQLRAERERALERARALEEEVTGMDARCSQLQHMSDATRIEKEALAARLREREALSAQLDEQRVGLERKLAAVEKDARSATDDAKRATGQLRQAIVEREEARQALKRKSPPAKPEPLSPAARRPGVQASTQRIVLEHAARGGEIPRIGSVLVHAGLISEVQLREAWRPRRRR